MRRSVVVEDVWSPTSAATEDDYDDDDDNDNNNHWKCWGSRGQPEEEHGEPKGAGANGGGPPLAAALQPELQRTPGPSELRTRVGRASGSDISHGCCQLSVCQFVVSRLCASGQQTTTNPRDFEGCASACVTPAPPCVLSRAGRRGLTWDPVGSHALSQLAGRGAKLEYPGEVSEGQCPASDGRVRAAAGRPMQFVSSQREWLAMEGAECQ